MGFNPLHIPGNSIKCHRHDPYYAAKLDVKIGQSLDILAEPTVLLLFVTSFQRIEIRCYNIGRGYASI